MKFIWYLIIAAGCCVVGYFINDHYLSGWVSGIVYMSLARIVDIIYETKKWNTMN